MKLRLRCGGLKWQDAFTHSHSFPPLLFYALFFILWASAGMSNAALTSTDSIAWTEAQIVSLLTSPLPPGTAKQPFPVYGSVANSSLRGVYCVDKDNEVVYVGSNVLHVYKIRQRNAFPAARVDAQGTAAEGEAAFFSSSSAYYFEHLDTLDVDGWATACVFVNRYELYVTTVAVEELSNGRDSGVPFSSDEAGPAASTDSGRRYTVINRDLRRVMRRLVVPTPVTAASPLLASSVKFGMSVVVPMPDTSNAKGTRVVTPFWDSLLCIDDFQSTVTTTQYVRLDSLSIPQLLAAPGFGQQRGNTTLYALTFPTSQSSVDAVSLDDSGASAITIDGVSGDGDTEWAASPSAAAPLWDIEGVALPDAHQNVDAVPVTPAITTERFARCYASTIAEQCADCVPVALATSNRGLIVAFTSQSLNATYVTLLASNTRCTTGVEDADAAERSMVSAISASVSSSSPSGSPDGTSNAVAPTSLLFDDDGLEIEESEAAAESDASVGENEPLAELLQIASSVCKVPAMVADDYAAPRVYIALVCADASGSLGQRRQTWLACAEAGGIGDGGAAPAVTSILVQAPVFTAEEEDDGTKEVMTLALSNASRLLYLSVRHADATVQVYTYAAFGLSSVLPPMVDILGGTPVALKGYGFVPGMECVFAGSGNALVTATLINSTDLICLSPSFTEDICHTHRVSMRMAYTDPWAIPAPTPRNAVVSPVAVQLSYLTTPVVLNVLDQKTGTSIISVEESVTIVVHGYEFLNGTKYGLDSKCRCEYWTGMFWENVYTNAVYLDEIYLSCTFVGLVLTSNPLFIYVSMDGSVFSTGGAYVQARGSAVGLSLQIETTDLEEGELESGGSIFESSYSPNVRSSAHTKLPTIQALFVDSAYNMVPSPEDPKELFAFFGLGIVSAFASVINAIKLTEIPGSTFPIRGTTLQPFSADGVAVFQDIEFDCPPSGEWSFEVCVSNGTHLLLDYLCTGMSVIVREGIAHAPVFVGGPSTQYSPDASLLTVQPVIGVQDTCGNVYTYLNASVFLGPLTVQLYYEVLALNFSTGEFAVTAAAAYGTPWTLSTPLNNFFYISNISFPSQVFGMRFYINVTGNLPQPTAVSPYITATSCQPNRQSVITQRSASAEGDGSVFAWSIECGPCPQHSICNGTSSARAQDGYWRYNDSSTVFTSCRVGYGMAEACVDDGQCAPGYRGVLCGECEPGYHTLGRACRKCLSRGLQSFLVVVVALMMVLLMTAFVVALTVIPPSSLLVLSIRCLILSVQVSSLFIYINIPWPTQVERLFNGLYATAQLMETIITCFLSPAGYLILTACSPVVLVFVVTILAGVCVRSIRVHRADAHRLCAVVLMALLHRKQERFHQLRHTIAQEMSEQGAGSPERRNTSSGGQETAPPESYSVSASATRLSMSAEWAAMERGVVRMARPSLRSTQVANSCAGAALSDGAPTSAATMAATSASSTQGTTRGMESVVIDAFAAQTAAVMERLTAAEPEATWEQLVVKGMREENGELLSAVRQMRLPLLTRKQVQEWAAHTTEINVDVSKKRSREARRVEESVNSSTKSAGSAREASPSHRRPSHSADATEGASSYRDPNEVKGTGVDLNDGSARSSVPVLWKRVGMISAYREIAVYQFRGSWFAMLASSASVVFVCYYLPLILNAFLWLQCITVRVGGGSAQEDIVFPMMNSMQSCSSATYHSMRKLAIAMLVLYGCCTPIVLVISSILCKEYYGEDVMYAAFPVVFFGDSTSDSPLSVSFMLTKLIAVIAATQTDSPMLQMSVLGVLFTFTIYLSSMWSGAGDSIVMRSRFLTLTQRSVLTVSRLLFSLVCEILLLLLYLILSGFELSSAGEHGFVAIISLGIGGDFVLFTVVSLHQALEHLRYARNWPCILAARKREEQLLLEALVRRYQDISQAIELYLKVCDRGLLVAQQLDTLSRFTHLVDDETATLADENILSFSSINDMDNVNAHSAAPDVGRGRRKGTSALPSASISAATASTAAESSAVSPEALTHFSPYPQLFASEYPSQALTAPSAAPKTSSKVSRRQREERRRTAPHLSAAFRATAGSRAAHANPSSSSSSLSSHPKAGGGGVPASVCSPLRDTGFPGDVHEVLPVEGNANWVSAPNRASAGSAKDVESAGAPTRGGEDNVGVAAGTVALVDLSAGTPLSPESTASVREPEGATTAVAVTVTRSSDKMKRAHHLDAAPLPLRKASDVISGDYTEIQLPVPQPPLRRSDSLLLSIRCLEPEYTTKTQSTRDKLVEASRAAATAEYRRERHRQQRRQAACTRVANDPLSANGDNTESAPTKAADFAVPSRALESTLHPRSETSKTVTTIESFAPVVELDLASSFDPLAVPPLPLTRALMRPRRTASFPLTGSAANMETRGSTQTLLAALQGDLEAELRQLHAMPLHDALLDIDLGLLANVPSQLQHLHPISFWGGETPARELVDSALPLSGAGRSSMGNMATGKGPATSTSGATLPTGRSLSNGRVETPSAIPIGARLAEGTASNSPVTPGGMGPAAAVAANTSTEASRAGHGSLEHGDDALSSSDTSISPVIPPLPRFAAPHHRPHTSHRTAAEYMRRRAAQASRTPRSRSEGHNAPRSRAKPTAAGVSRAPREAKKLSSAEEKPKLKPSAE